MYVCAYKILTGSSDKHVWRVVDSDEYIGRPIVVKARGGTGRGLERFSDITKNPNFDCFGRRFAL